MIQISSFICSFLIIPTSVCHDFVLGLVSTLPLRTCCQTASLTVLFSLLPSILMKPKVVFPKMVAAHVESVNLWILVFYLSVSWGQQAIVNNVKGLKIILHLSGYGCRDSLCSEIISLKYDTWHFPNSLRCVLLGFGTSPHSAMQDPTDIA